MKAGQIRLITFDALNTIIHFKEPVPIVYCRFAKEEGVENISSDQIKISFRKSYKKLSSNSPCFGYTVSKNPLVTSKKWWLNCVKSTFTDAINSSNSTTGVSGEQLEKVAENLYKYYNTTDPWILEPSAKSIFAYFKTKGLSLGVLSNYDSRLRNIFEKLDVAHYFDAFVLSGELGVEKPNVKIFQYMENSLKIYTNEIVHVGDDVEKDYLGAKNAGWNAFLVGNGKNRKTDTNFPPSDVLVRLADLRNKIV